MNLRTCRGIAGFSLVEVTLALGVAGFCLLAIFGLLPVALNSNQAAIEQTAANNILSAVISDLKATPVTVPPGAAAKSQQYQIDLPESGQAGNPSPIFFNSEQQLVNKQADGRYRVTVAFPAGPGGRTATWGTVKVTWPAPVDPAKGTPAGSATSFIALDRN